MKFDSEKYRVHLHARCADHPEDVAAWRALGGHYASVRKLDEARVCLERVLRLTPEDDDCASLLGWVLNEQGHARDALAVLNPGGGDRPVAFNRLLRFALLLPQVYESHAALDWWRRRYIDGLNTLAAMPERYCPDPGQVMGLTQTNFLLAYQGADDLDLQRTFANLIGSLIAKAYPDLVRPLRPRKREGRIRVAFVSGQLHSCTIGHYFRSWVERIAPSEFEVVAIYTGNTPDRTTDEIKSRASRFIAPNGATLDTARMIRDIEADILIYPEVGMHSKTHLLTNMRLAPVQCAAWGHPVTTGSAQIDYYFTCAEMEPGGAERQYSERLLFLPGIGTYYNDPATAGESVTREDLGIPTDKHLYLCGQSLFKIHPDNDALFLDLIEADEQAILAFYQDPSTEITLAFAGRLTREMARRGLPQRKQIKFLPFTTAERFREIAVSADVVLDTLHWSGGNTSLDILSRGVPIVTMPGAFMRGRQSAAMLRAIQVPELVVQSPGEYLKLVIRIASDPDYNQSLRCRILAGKSELFNRDEPIHAFEEHLRMLRS